LEENNVRFGFFAEMDKIFKTGHNIVFGDSILRFEGREEIMDIVG